RPRCGHRTWGHHDQQIHHAEEYECERPAFSGQPLRGQRSEQRKQAFFDRCPLKAGRWRPPTVRGSYLRAAAPCHLLCTAKYFECISSTAKTMATTAQDDQAMTEGGMNAPDRVWKLLRVVGWSLAALILLLPLVAMLFTD